MILLQNISIQFGGEYLFRNLVFQIGAHDRIGLVGANGTGKTTLLKILTGLSQPDNGSVIKANYVTVGYLPQEYISSSDKTLFEEVKSAFDDLNLIEKQLEEITDQIQNHNSSGSSDEYNELIELQGELQYKLENLDAYRKKSQIEKVLMGLGFSFKDFDRHTEEFSGGWQMRILLAKLLLQNPALLLLDEPTNHLDLDSLRWLEEYLKSYAGSIIIVSHDRTFLDNITTKTLALRSGKFEVYSGNYSFYEIEQQNREELLLNAAKNQQQQIKQTQRFIERFRYKATKARQVQSRIKQLEKIELIDFEEGEKEISFNFPQTINSGAVVLELNNLTMRYPVLHKQYESEEITVFENLNLAIERGDRIALVGVNGAGKSTLSRIICGTEKPTSGNVKFGYNVRISYFAQNQVDELEADKEIIEVAESAASDENRTQIRTLLGCFLFEGDDVFKKVRVLSGGEKSRLALTKMLLTPANFLIMDEPTNHLDMRSKKVLQEALKKFDGTYLIVSHDRHFLDSIVNKVIEVSNQSIKTYLGNISDYIYKKDQEKLLSTLTDTNLKKEKHGEGIISEKERKRIEAEERQRLYKITKPVKEKLEKIEKQIKEKESLKINIETRMAEPDFYSNQDQVKKVSADYKTNEMELQNLYIKWAELSEELEKLSMNNKNMRFF